MTQDNSLFKPLTCGKENGQPVIIQHISQKVSIRTSIDRVCIVAQSIISSSLLLPL